MTRAVAVYQPHYLPRLHYLARAAHADAFVLLDDVDFARQSPQHRAPLPDDWLTVPVRHEDALIDEARVDATESWARRHLRTLEATYGSEVRRLEPFYRPFVDVTDAELRALAREHPTVDAARAFLDADRALRERRDHLDALRAARTHLGRRIAEADEAREGLRERARACGRAVERVETRVTALRERRDEHRDAVRTLGWGPRRERLVDLTISLLRYLFDAFDVATPCYRSSELGVARTADASVYNARLVDALDGDRYVSGEAGYEAYLDETPFDERDIDVTVQDWTPPWPDGNVCCVDVLVDADDPGAFVRRDAA